ncbi:MAG: hypothetical protein M1839_004030 [Geoglossum umbratile]|nr:MAG: hypothetical protein M1839_004030 [Geoglossum umbratile]
MVSGSTTPTGLPTRDLSASVFGASFLRCRTDSWLRKTLVYKAELLATGNAISTIHVYTGSKVTWVSSRTIRWLALAGSQILENTAGHLGCSIEEMRLQEDYPDISNEDIDDSIYSALARTLNNCSPVMTSSEKPPVASNQIRSCNGEYSKESPTNTSTSLGVAIPSKAKKVNYVSFSNGIAPK